MSKTVHISFRHKSDINKISCKFQVQVANVEMSLLSVNLNVFFMLVTLSCKRIDNVLNVQEHCLQSLSDMITSRVSIVCYHADTSRDRVHLFQNKCIV